MRYQGYRVLTTLVLGLHLAGCMTWKPTQVSAREFLEEQQPDWVKVRLTVGQPFEVRNPWLDGDALRGERRCGGAEVCEQDGAPVHIPLNMIQELETRRFNVVLTLIPITLVALFVDGVRRSFH